MYQFKRKTTQLIAIKHSDLPIWDPRSSIRINEVQGSSLTTWCDHASLSETDATRWKKQRIDILYLINRLINQRFDQLQDLSATYPFYAWFFPQHDSKFSYEIDGKSYVFYGHRDKFEHTLNLLCETYYTSFELIIPDTIYKLDQKLSGQLYELSFSANTVSFEWAIEIAKYYPLDQEETQLNINPSIKAHFTAVLDLDTLEVQRTFSVDNMAELENTTIQGGHSLCEKLTQMQNNPESNIWHRLDEAKILAHAGIVLGMRRPGKYTSKTSIQSVI